MTITQVGFNLEPLTGYMPEMGSMVGYAITVRIEPSKKSHADRHGFLAVREEDEEGFLDGSLFMDQNECSTVIPAARSASGKSHEDILKAMNEAGKAIGEAAKRKFGRKGEW